MADKEKNNVTLNDQMQVRLEKMDALKKQGIAPFGHRFKQEAHAAEIKEKYSDKNKEELDDLNVNTSVAGRIMMKRRMGKMGFISLLDKTGRIQVVLNQRILGEQLYELFKKADLGDIIGIIGKVVKTQTGELSIEAHDYIHLSKALRPLPDKFHGLQDKEERYRRRYLDLITNDESRKVAILRSKIIASIRHYMDQKGYIEVETPVLQPVLTGASARPFITHHNALNRDFYLRIATELPLKRLIVGGLEKVYEIGRIFRNEGMDLKHNPEFTTMEAYCAYADMQDMMDLTEELYESVALEVFGKTDFTFMGKTISLKAPFKRWHMVDAVKECTGIDFWQEMSLEKALALAKEHHVEVAEHQKTVGHIISLFFEQFCEDKIEQPTFIWGHPIEISPLSKKAKDPRFTERFELSIMGIEMNNAFSELNDPIDQKERFLKQLQAKEAGDEEASEMDQDYIEALEYGLPPTGGIGFGIDRFVMLLTGKDSIRDVLLFPTMKPLDNDQKIKQESSKTDIKIDFSKVKVEPLFTEMVDFDTFSKSDFRVVKVKNCEEVPKSKKLLKFTLDDGSEKERVILSGIKEYYSAESLIGKTLLAICNLPPRKMMGIDSEGMIISAICEYDGEEKLNLIMLDDNIPAGSKLY